MLRDYDSVCNDFGSTIGNWQSGKNPGRSVEAKKFCKFCVAGATEISNWEIDVTCVEAGSITDVVMLKLKWWRVRNGSVISVDRRDSDC